MRRWNGVGGQHNRLRLNLLHVGTIFVASQPSIETGEMIPYTIPSRTAFNETVELKITDCGVSFRCAIRCGSNYMRIAFYIFADEIRLNAVCGIALGTIATHW